MSFVSREKRVSAWKCKGLFMDFKRIQSEDRERKGLAFLQAGGSLSSLCFHHGQGESLCVNTTGGNTSCKYVQ